jgi:hypothetical protein
VEIDRQSRRRLKLQGAIFLLLLFAMVALIAWLSVRWRLEWDWTHGGRNSLSQASAELVATLDGPIEIVAYASHDPVLRGRMESLIGRYRRHHPALTLRYVDPELEPALMRDLGIRVDGELSIHHGGRSERVEELNEMAISTALQRLARAGERWLTFLSGHGERDPLGEANHDLGRLGELLEQRGVQIATLYPGESNRVPDNSSALVIAGPRVALLEAELALIGDWIDGGGNLLWLTDPGEAAGLEPIADRLGIYPHNGVIVDPATTLFGIDNPSFSVVADYPPTLLSDHFDLVTLFPQASPLLVDPASDWELVARLESAEKGWVEWMPGTGDGAGDGDGHELPVQGPFTLLVAMERQQGGRLQRVVVVGDGDFLSNAYIGNGGNLDLALRLVDWLNRDDRLLEIAVEAAPDRSLVLSATYMTAIGALFLLILPAIFLLAGVAAWWRRRD